jgi:hypothetical protein
VADDEGTPPLLRTMRDRVTPLPTAGFRFALTLAKRASGEGRPARAVLVQGASLAPNSADVRLRGTRLARRGHGDDRGYAVGGNSSSRRLCEYSSTRFG